jgi:hypothetical protein
MKIGTVCRLHNRETTSRRIVLVARVAADIPAGASVALVDIRGELFLQVLEGDGAGGMTRHQVDGYRDTKPDAPHILNN